MMGRAGAFYSPFHSMWTGFNSNTNSQKYNNFGYPPTPPKDSSTPDQGQPTVSSADEYAGHHSGHMNNNNLANETKPSAEHLMSSAISSLSAYAGLPGSGVTGGVTGGRKLPEGNGQHYSSPTDGSTSSSSMFYYPTSSDLTAMYGSSGCVRSQLQSSRPKSKNRSNAGKQIDHNEWHLVVEAWTNK